MKGALFKVHKKESAAVFHKTAEVIGVKLGEARFTCTSMTDLADGAFRGTPEWYGTHGLAERFTGKAIREDVRKAVIVAKVFLRHTEEANAML